MAADAPAPPQTTSSGSSWDWRSYLPNWLRQYIQPGPTGPAGPQIRDHPALAKKGGDADPVGQNLLNQIAPLNHLVAYAYFLFGGFPEYDTNGEQFVLPPASTEPNPVISYQRMLHDPPEHFDLPQLEENGEAIQQQAAALTEEIQFTGSFADRHRIDMETFQANWKAVLGGHDDFLHGAINKLQDLGTSILTFREYNLNQNVNTIENQLEAYESDRRLSTAKIALNAMKSMVDLIFSNIEKIAGDNSPQRGFINEVNDHAHKLRLPMVPNPQRTT